MFPSHFKFPKSVIPNTKSLNFDKLMELKVLSEFNQSDVTVVTEVQSNDLRSLCLPKYSVSIKLCPLDHPLGKKGGGIMFLLNATFSLKLFLFLIYLRTMKSFG